MIMFMSVTSLVITYLAMIKITLHCEVLYCNYSAEVKRTSAYCTLTLSKLDRPRGSHRLRVLGDISYAV